MANAVKVMMTEDDDNVVWNPARVSWMLGNIAYIAFTVWAMMDMSWTFDPQAFGIGWGAVNAAGGGATMWTEK